MTLPIHQSRRDRMVEQQIVRRGIQDQRVVRAMRMVPREVFVDLRLEDLAYRDAALPIDEGQTISQPYVVALMIAAADVRSTDRVLEVGAGSGYVAAVLSRIAAEVYAIERHDVLVDKARRRLERLGYHNVTIRVGDGTLGWLEMAPFDAILVSAGAPSVPPALKEQLAVGGRLVMPVGKSAQSQHLVKLTRSSVEVFEEEVMGAVRFVPLVGG